MKTSAIFMVIGGLAACGGTGHDKVETAPTPSATVATISTTSTTAVVPVSGADTSAPIPTSELPPQVDGPSTVACVFQTKDWGNGTIRLRFSAKDEPFATINRPSSVRVSLPGGKSSDASLVEIETSSAKLRVAVAGEEVPLFPTAATHMQGYVVPLNTARLKWSSAAVDAVTFSVDPGANVRTRTDLKSTRPCAYFSLNEGAFDSLTATGSPATGRVGILRPMKSDLAIAMDGQPVASLDVNDSSQRVAILAVSGTKSRIAWRTKDALVFGWVPSDALVNTSDPVSLVPPPSDPALRPQARTTSVASWQRTSCPEDVSLVAEYKGTLKTIGTIKGKKSFDLGPVRGGWNMVALPDSDVLPSTGATLYITRANAAKCNVTPTPL